MSGETLNDTQANLNQFNLKRISFTKKLDSPSMFSEAVRCDAGILLFTSARKGTEHERLGRYLLQRWCAKTLFTYCRSSLVKSI